MKTPLVRMRKHSTQNQQRKQQRPKPQENV